MEIFKMSEELLKTLREEVGAEQADVDVHGRCKETGRFLPGKAKAGPGRPKGSRNKLSQKMLDRFARATEEGLSPEDVMIQLFQDPEMSPDLRFKAACKMGDWIYPKAASVEVKVDEKESMTAKQIDEKLKQLIALGSM